MNLSRPRLSLKTAIVLLSIFAIGFWLYGQVTPLWQHYQHLRAAVNRSADKSFINLGEVVANLKSPTQTRFASIGVSIQVAPENDLIVAKSVEDNEVALRDALIRNLRSKTINDLQGSEGMDQLRDEMTDEFERILFPENRIAVQKVVFDKFLIQ